MRFYAIARLRPGTAADWTYYSTLEEFCEQDDYVLTPSTRTALLGLWHRRQEPVLAVITLSTGESITYHSHPGHTFEYEFLMNWATSDGPSEDGAILLCLPWTPEGTPADTYAYLALGEVWLSSREEAENAGFGPRLAEAIASRRPGVQGVPRSTSRPKFFPDIVQLC